MWWAPGRSTRLQSPAQRSNMKRMAMPTWLALVALVLAVQSAAIRHRASSAQSAAIHLQEKQRANPIRKVVRLLQNMQTKVAQEGEEGEELYKKYMCYCKSSGGELAERISDAEAKIPATGSDIEAAEVEQAKLDEDVKQAQADRLAANTSINNAVATRKKEAAAFAKEKSDYETNIAAIKKALDALTTGSYGSFLQTDAAATLRKVLSTSSVVLSAGAMDMPEIISFLTGTQAQTADYAPQGGEVIGILKQLSDEMTKDLGDIVDTEAKAIQGYNDLMKAATKEVISCTERIERKMGRSADLGVSIVSMKNDLTDLQADLLEDRKFVEDLNATCANKTSEWEESKKTRKLELAAIAETIEMLNGDDALELFKSTLPGTASSFVQLAGPN